MGFHHFHLGEKVEAAGHVERTDDVLFARVSRGNFTAIGIFNHSVFEPATDATSGHPIHVAGTAQEYSRIIYDLDPKLDDPSLVNELYGGSNASAPANVKLELALNFSDIGIHETRSNHLFVLRRGFN